MHWALYFISLRCASSSLKLAALWFLVQSALVTLHHVDKVCKSLLFIHRYVPEVSADGLCGGKKPKALKPCINIKATYPWLCKREKRELLPTLWREFWLLQGLPCTAELRMPFRFWFASKSSTFTYSTTKVQVYFNDSQPSILAFQLFSWRERLDCSGWPVATKPCSGPQSGQKSVFLKLCQMKLYALVDIKFHGKHKKIFITKIKNMCSLILISGAQTIQTWSLIVKIQITSILKISL